eukprot:1300603-Rhodomonas_salina.1
MMFRNKPPPVWYKTLPTRGGFCGVERSDPHGAYVMEALTHAPCAPPLVRVCEMRERECVCECVGDDRERERECVCVCMGVWECTLGHSRYLVPDNASAGRGHTLAGRYVGWAQCNAPSRAWISAQRDCTSTTFSICKAPLPKYLPIWGGGPIREGSS